MKFKSIELDDKKIFDEYYKTHQPYSAYLSFTTLYTWQDLTNARYMIFDNELILKMGKDDGHYVLLGTDEESIKKVVDFLFTKGKVNIKIATNTQMEIIKKLYGDKFNYEHKRNNDNYFYLTEKLITLSGKKLHSKRNFLNRFKKENEYTYEKITSENLYECINVAKDWCKRKCCDENEVAYREISACEMALMNMDKLSLKGGALRVDGKIVAFSVGELLNPKTALIHFEKADTSYNGVYQAINNEFLKNEWADTIYVNREEDMGDEGLRKAKLSYYPEFLLEFYAISENN